MVKNNITLSNIIIALTVLMYIVQINITNGSIYLGLNRYFLDASFYWQPLSSMFTHGGIGHLGMNMFVLYQFGNLIEKYAGVKTLFFLYFIGGLFTSVASFYVMQLLELNANLVGASGALCVLLGYVALKDVTQRKGIITWVLLISVAPLIIGLPIAWYAHFLGLFFGFLLGKFIR